MSNHEEIKQALANQNIKQGILIALSNSLQIKIASTIRENENKTQQIITNINLIKGINTKIDAEILEQEQGQNLMNFHHEQLSSVDEMWQKNRETLIKIYQLLSGNLPENEIVKSQIFPHIGRVENDNEQQADTSRQSNLIGDEFENFDLELVAEEKTEQKEIDTPNPEELSEVNISEVQEENWLDEIDEEIDNTPENELTSEESSQNFPAQTNDIESQLEWQNSSPEESFTTEMEEEMIDEEVEISSEIDEEDWGDIDWEQEIEENEASDIQEQNPDNADDISLDDESSPSLEIDDDWREWIDEDDLSSSPSNSEELKDIDWSQEDWQNAN